MLRSIAKTGFACVYAWSGAARLSQRHSTPASPFIVGYHRVVEDFRVAKRSTIPSMLTSRAMLERHIDWLARRFSIVSLDDIGRHIESRRPFPRRAAAITFDDGYADVFHHAFPLLVKKGIPAAVFVVTGLTGAGRTLTFEGLHQSLRSLKERGFAPRQTVAAAFRSKGIDPQAIERLQSADRDLFTLMTSILTTFPQKDIEAILPLLEQSSGSRAQDSGDLSLMSWDMIRNMHRAGITIGSHTASHCLLTAESPQVVESELTESKRRLEAELGASIHHFAYPDGRFNSAVVQSVNAAGYRYAYGICDERDSIFPRLTITRLMLWERSCLNALGRFSSSIMQCHTQGILKRNRCDHDHRNPTEAGNNGTVS